MFFLPFGGQPHLPLSASGGPVARPPPGCCPPRFFLVLGVREGRGTARAAPGLTKFGCGNPRLFGCTCTPRLTGLLRILRTRFPGAPLPDFLAPSGLLWGELRAKRRNPIPARSQPSTTLARLDVPDQDPLPSPSPSVTVREASRGTPPSCPLGLGPSFSPSFLGGLPGLRMPRATHSLPLFPARVATWTGPNPARVP